MHSGRIWTIAAIAACLTGCPFDNQEEVGETEPDAIAGPMDAAVGEGGEGGEGEGEGEGEGGEGEGEGEGGEGEGDCEAGAARECEADCVIGEQRCREGAWTLCEGRVRCDDARCAAAHPDACGEPACEAGDARRCGDDCVAEGEQTCGERGRWSACEGRVRCDVAACAREYPDACGEGPACEDGAARACEAGCFSGEQVCRDGAWTECTRGRPRCDVAECARELPDLCGEPPACEDGAARECEARCFVGEQSCVDGGWGECVRRRPRCEVAECARELPDVCERPAECEAGAARECERPCFFGEQVCREGAWTECTRDVPRCDIAECARELPDLCDAPAACEAGTGRECESPCFFGEQVCREGAWSECMPRRARCDIPECARELPALCGAPPACEEGAARECERPCFFGEQVCREGAWTECTRDVPRCDIAACARELPDLCAAPVEPAECEAGAGRECEARCFVGEQVCREGAWAECMPRRARCDLPECARELPDLCL